MELLSYSEIHGPKDEYAWTIIYKYKSQDEIYLQKEFLTSLLNSRYLNRFYFKNSINQNSFINKIWRPIPLNRLTADDFEFITTENRLCEVFNLEVFIIDSKNKESNKYYTEVLDQLLNGLRNSNGIWHISSQKFEDDYKNDFVKAGISTELYISIDVKNQIVTTLDFGHD